MITILSITQIVISVALIIAILLQSSAAGLGTAFGGADSDTSYHTRRGFEKILFNGTIILAILFAVVSFLIFSLS